MAEPWAKAFEPLGVLDQERGGLTWYIGDVPSLAQLVVRLIRLGNIAGIEMWGSAGGGGTGTASGRVGGGEGMGGSW